MLDYLNIKNVALIENLSVNFFNGFNVLIGETGAGKTIIIDALKFLLGEKADKTLIRSGKDYMRVEASFSDYKSNTILLDYLTNAGIDELEDVLVFTRSLNINGKSDCRINGNLVTVSTLKQIGNQLINVYSQSDSSQLLNDKNHLAILDSYKPQLLEQDKNRLSFLVDKLNEINNSIKNIGGSVEDRLRELDVLDYQIKEIENAKIQDNEDDFIKTEITKLSNIEKIVSNLTTCLDLLEGHSPCYVVDNIKTSIKNLNLISNLDSNYEQLGNRLSNLKYELDDIISTLHKEISLCVFDDKLLEKYDERLDYIKKLKNKYGGSIQGIYLYLEKSKQSYERLINSEKMMDDLNNERKKLMLEIYEISQTISQIRRNIAVEIEKNITNELNDLGMKNTKFAISFLDLPIQADIENISITKNGFDVVTFKFSANIGEQLKDLSKTISGGEMSRFMLAFKTVMSKDEGNNLTLIFDEIDSGISGKIGLSVAQKIAMISKSAQILCVTHLPQVASMADNYYYVYKQTENGKTFSNVRQLNTDEIISQIANISGGLENSENSHNYALELKRWCDNFKLNLNK